MSRTRRPLAAALLALAALAGLRALPRPPEPYATLARDAAMEPPAWARPAVAHPAGASLPRAAAPPAAAPATRREPPPAGALRAALATLDRARAAGYADPVAADPDAWAAPSCACRVEDARRLRDLAGRGHALRGHRATLLAVRVVRAGPAAATLVVTDRVGRYAAVDRRGRVTGRWPASPPRRWRVTLVLSGGRWLLGAVARAP